MLQSREACPSWRASCPAGQHPAPSILIERWCLMRVRARVLRVPYDVPRWAVEHLPREATRGAD